MPKSTSPHKKELEWLAKLELGRLNNELGKKPSIVKITQAVKSHYRKVDEALIATDTQEGSDIECKKGCSMCCHTIVFANMAEIATAYLFIKENFSQNQTKDIKDKLTASYMEIMDAHSRNESTTITCPLLENGNCQIYPVRPSHCRNSHSLNSLKCKEAFEHPDNNNELIPVNPTRVEISRLMLSALASSLNEKTLDHHLLEFSTVLLALLDSPSIMQKWASSKRTSKY